MKKRAPAVARNRDAIATVLVAELPASGTVLELASGTGEHAVYFASRFPRLVWQPSDPSEDARSSIGAWREEEGLQNLLAPIAIDAAGDEWPMDNADAVVCINMVHISPWAASVGLFSGAAKLLSADAPLVLYGPYLEQGVETAQSNLDFDASLKSRDPRWGLRNLSDIDELATSYGFERTARHQMPANNLTLIYRRM